MTTNSPILIDDDTIDINQLDPQEPLSSTIKIESYINNSTSMEAAVKMVQPIIDIIFHAFEDQLKHVQTKSIQPPASLSDTSPIAAPFCSPLIMPYFPLSSPPPPRPIVLHAVNFNIQLSRKQSESNAQHLTNENSLEKDNSLLTDVQERLASYILSNHFLDGNHQGRQHFKRIAQLAVVGLSALCGYWLL